MPKRSNEFQRVVMLLKRHAAPLGATVTESKLLKDLITGKEREVDICIDHNIAGQPITISIECVDKSRRANVEWVEQMKSKHDRLPTNALILISRRGFSKEAIEVAKKTNITLLKLEEFDDKSTERIFKDTNSLWLKAFTLEPTKVNFVVELKGDVPEENVVVTNDIEIYNKEGVQIGTAHEAVQSILRRNDIQLELGSKGTEKHRFFEFHLEPVVNDGVHIYLKHLEHNELRMIKSIHIIGTVKPYISEFPLVQGEIGEDKIAWGTGTIFGEDTLIVTSEDATGNLKLSIKTEETD